MERFVPTWMKIAPSSAATNAAAQVALRGAQRGPDEHGRDRRGQGPRPGGHEPDARGARGHDRADYFAGRARRRLAPPRRGGAPRRAGGQRPAYADLLVAAARGRGGWPPAASGPATASASRSRPARPSPSRCTPACASARSPSRSTCASAADGRAGSRAAAAVVVEAPLPGDGDEAGAAVSAARPRRAGDRGPQRDERAAEAGRADLRQLAVERARVGVALGCDPDERWLCALPLSTSAACRSSCAAHRRDDRRRARALRHRAGARGAGGREDGPTIVSLVPTTLARLLDAGPARAARPALGAPRRRARARRRSLERARAARASRSPRPTG